jgi:hypothetical protein
MAQRDLVGGVGDSLRRGSAGALGSSCGRRLTSRATLGTRTDGTTWPKITSSTSRPSSSARMSSSRAAWRASAVAETSRKTVPLLAKGVRMPATMATRRPGRESCIASGSEVRSQG